MLRNLKVLLGQTVSAAGIIQVFPQDVAFEFLEGRPFEAVCTSFTS